MIPEPRYSKAKPRNNNLLCYAIILFVIGFTLVQIAGPLLLYWSIFPFLDPLILIILLLIGAIAILGGVYIMWRWWQSGL
ncbi:MAG: hypothetical protein JW779_09440 [Candidatus Thorarchaeota archaeon]|nr:hypothetical protein [Candidatus Thorarchaeota archaeon]